MKHFFILNMDGDVEYLFIHFNWPYPSPHSTTGCVPKNNNFSKQLVLTHSLVELWHAFLHPYNIRSLAVVGCETYWFVPRMPFRYSCPHDQMACVHCGVTPIILKIVLLCPVYVWTLKRTTTITCLNIQWRAASTGGQHLPPTLGNVSQPGQPNDSRLWYSQATNCYNRLAMPSTVQSAIVLPVTSCTCVKYVVPTTVPGSAPTRAVPLSKPTPLTLLQPFILECELSNHLDQAFVK